MDSSIILNYLPSTLDYDSSLTNAEKQSISASPAYAGTTWVESIKYRVNGIYNEFSKDNIQQIHFESQKLAYGLGSSFSAWNESNCLNYRSYPQAEFKAMAIKGYLTDLGIDKDTVPSYSIQCCDNGYYTVNNDIKDSIVVGSRTYTANDERRIIVNPNRSSSKFLSIDCKVLKTLLYKYGPLYMEMVAQNKFDNSSKIRKCDNPYSSADGGNSDPNSHRYSIILSGYNSFGFIVRNSTKKQSRQIIYYDAFYYYPVSVLYFPDILKL